MTNRPVPAPKKSGAFKKVESNLSNAIRGADVVIYATPVLAMREMMEASVNDFEEGCVVTTLAAQKRSS
ncbi:MAG: hypothetical protein CM1200mP27_13180 [Chloroflexota bacterium]|nr:MAG: hypothetical protein CM1200mP27_13180 [Chloroflexota bacterium]